MEYQHGGDIHSQDMRMSYSANINPLGMPEVVRQVLRDCLERGVCSLYPGSRRKRLGQALDRHHEVEGEWIICDNGAIGLTFGPAAALHPICGLMTAPVFSEHEQVLRSVECRADYYCLREDGGLTLNVVGVCGYIRAAVERDEPYDMMLFYNPNDPTGIPIKKEKVKRLTGTCE